MVLWWPCGEYRSLHDQYTFCASLFTFDSKLVQKFFDFHVNLLSVGLLLGSLKKYSTPYRTLVFSAGEPTRNRILRILCNFWILPAQAWKYLKPFFDSHVTLLPAELFSDHEQKWHRLRDAHSCTSDPTGNRSLQLQYTFWIFWSPKAPNYLKSFSILT